MAPHIPSNFPSKYWKCAEKYQCSEARRPISIYPWGTLRPSNKGGGVGSQLLIGRDKEFSSRVCYSL